MSVFARRIFSFPVFLGVLLISGVFFGARVEGSRGDLLFSEGDMWWHLRAGEDILETHAFPQRDTYAATARGTDWIAYEWLGEVGIAAVFRAGQLSGLKCLDLGLACVLLLLLFGHALQRSHNSKAAFIACAVFLPVFLGFCTMRPQLFGWIFFLLTLIAVESFERGNNRAVWYLPPIFLLWVNTHGTFVLGLLALTLAWAGAYLQFERNGIFAERWDPARRRTFAMATLACFAVLPITPYGTRLSAYPLELAIAQPTNVANIQEWLPLSTERFLSAAVLILLATFFLSVIFGGAKCRVSEGALVLLCAFGSAIHLRFVILFVFVAVPFFAVGIRRAVPIYNAERDHPVWNAALILLVLAGCARSFPSQAQLHRALTGHYPVGALQSARSIPLREPLFNDYGWGGYLIWRGALMQGVFVDGRADVHERAGTLSDYLRLARLEPGAFDVIEKYNLQSFLIRRDSALATALGASADWERTYVDNLAVIFVRRNRSHVSAQHEGMEALKVASCSDSLQMKHNGTRFLIGAETNGLCPTLVQGAQHSPASSLFMSKVSGPVLAMRVHGHTPGQ
ncbi:MAG: hypothetical protein WBP79_14805 [Candidatus Acidiferrales bacterium]